MPFEHHGSQAQDPLAVGSSAVLIISISLLNKIEWVLVALIITPPFDITAHLGQNRLQEHPRTLSTGLYFTSE
jgi:hypothetical protein